MIGTLESMIPAVLSLAALAYLSLAVYISRSSPHSIIGMFLLLTGALVAGSAFSYGAQSANIYGIGRALAYCAASFIPVAFYAIYRQYTHRVPGPFLYALLSIVPITTTVLAITNSMHELIWTTTPTADGMRFSDRVDHYWLRNVHAPFVYGLFGYSALALATRLPSIAPAHRRTVILLLFCALLPYGVSVANTFLGFGPPDFPFLSLSLTLLLPVYTYLALSMRVSEFSPVAYQMLFDHVRDPIIVLDNEERIICANRRASEMLGAPEADLLGRPLWQDFPEARSALYQAKELDLTQTLTVGPETTYEISVAQLTDRRGGSLGTVVVCRDVSERRKALAQLADSEHLIRTLIETSSNGILRFARDRKSPGRPFRCVFANRAAEGFLSRDASTLVGMPLEKLTPLEPARLIEHFADSRTANSPTSFETAHDGDGGETWLRIVGEPVGDDFSVTLIDITQRKRNEHKMMADALRDPLTGVLNRRGFEKEASTCIRTTDEGAVLYLDLNQFKSINDRFGHQAGDALLKAFGHRLEFCLRPEDVLGRLGGDEFAIVLPGVPLEDVKHIAERLVETASEAYIIQGQEITCSASVGIALMPRHGEELWHLISVADQAMYNAKRFSREEAANDRAAYVEAAIAS